MKRAYLVFEFWGCVALIILAFILLASCSTDAQRFDKRPDLCRDLGKKGREC